MKKIYVITSWDRWTPRVEEAYSEHSDAVDRTHDLKRIYKELEFEIHEVWLDQTED